MTREAKNPVQATRRSLAILEILFERGSVRLTDISRELDISDSTVHNHLSTLVESGFVTREGERYRVSLQFLTYGEYARSCYKINDTCCVELDDLASETDEAASAVVVEDELGYVLVHEPGADGLPIDLHPGKQLPLHATAFGKVLLADRPEEGINEFVDRRGLTAHTAETITDRSVLIEELAAIRSQGYAISDEERLRGVRSIAVAVRNEQGVAVGAIGITGPTSRLSDERLRGPLLKALTDTKNVIELQIAYS